MKRKDGEEILLKRIRSHLLNSSLNSPVVSENPEGVIHRLLQVICRPFRALFYRPKVRGLAPPPIIFQSFGLLKHLKREQSHLWTFRHRSNYSLLSMQFADFIDVIFKKRNHHKAVFCNNTIIIGHKISTSAKEIASINPVFAGSSGSSMNEKWRKVS